MGERHTTITCNEGDEWIFLVEAKRVDGKWGIIFPTVSEDEAIQKAQWLFDPGRVWRVRAVDVAGLKGDVVYTHNGRNLGGE